MAQQARSRSTPIPAPLQPVAATCPLHLTINTIGGRWKLHILRSLFVHGAQRFNELAGHIDGISAKELTRNLRELESGLLVTRVGSNTERRYELTRVGARLRPAFRKLGEFGVVLDRARRDTSGR